MVVSEGIYTTKVGAQDIDLPLVRIGEDLAIALLITVDHGVGFTERASKELADRLSDLDVDIVASVATMGIPLAIEVSRALGIDDYLIFQKTPKIHLADAISEPVKSITTGSRQMLLFDRARVHAASGRRRPRRRRHLDRGICQGGTQLVERGRCNSRGGGDTAHRGPGVEGHSRPRCGARALARCDPCLQVRPRRQARRRLGGKRRRGRSGSPRPHRGRLGRVYANLIGESGVLLGLTTHGSPRQHQVHDRTGTETGEDAEISAA